MEAQAFTNEQEAIFERIIHLFHDSAIEYALIGNVDKMDYVEVPQELLDLVYVPCEIRTIENKYYLVQDSKIIYGGLVDSEGLLGTIHKDITTLKEAMNLSIAALLGDKVKLAEYLDDENFLLEKALLQFQLGQIYYAENHGVGRLH